MKIKLLEARLIGDKMREPGEEVEMADEKYAEYLCKTHAARSLEKIDRLDEAIEKNDPNIILGNTDPKLEVPKKGKR